MLKSLLGNAFVQFLIGRSLGLYMLLVGVTTRWTSVGRALVEPYWAHPEARLIGCVWHGRFFLSHKLWRLKPGSPGVHFLISRSREGSAAAYAAQTVGGDVIRGSAAKGKQQKGGVAAGFEIIRTIDEGTVVMLTPDGPRGPRMRVKPGPVQLAKMAQAPLMPMAWSTQARVVMDSWDRFVLPLPFGRGALVWGNVIAPPSPDADAAEMERVRLQLETELNRINAEADRIAGVTPTEPAPERARARAASS